MKITKTKLWSLVFNIGLFMTFISCEKESVETDDLQTLQQEDVVLSKNDKIKKNVKVDVLVYDAETDTWKTISVSGNGNALQSLLNNGGIPIAYSPITEKIWMDRNLGATQVATSSTDAASYGDLYQWGRGTDGHQLRTSANTTTLSSTDVPVHGNFILVSSRPLDWRSPQNDNLWQGVNGGKQSMPRRF